MAIRTMGCIESSNSGIKIALGTKMHPPFDFLRPFSDGRSLWFIFDHRLFCIPSYLTTDGKECKCN